VNQEDRDWCKSGLTLEERHEAGPILENHREKDVGYALEGVNEREKVRIPEVARAPKRSGGCHFLLTTNKARNKGGIEEPHAVLV
jgi:hypothetical protein